MLTVFPKYMYDIAVPFFIAYQQNYISSQLIQKTAEIGLKQRADGEDVQVKRPQKRRRLDHLTIEEKRRLRKLKNGESSRISRQRAAEHKKHLEKQVLELHVQKAKLLLENKQLKAQSKCLENEKENLKKSLQTVDDRMQGSSCENLEGTFKHASFVNILLLKEWVLPQLFMMMVALREIFMISYQAQNFRKVQIASFHQTSDCVKLTQNLTYLIRGMIFQVQNFGKVQIASFHQTSNCVKLTQNLTSLIRRMMIFPMNSFKRFLVSLNPWLVTAM